MIFFRLQSWMFSLSWGGNHAETQTCYILLWRFGCSNDVVAPSFCPPLLHFLQYYRLLPFSSSFYIWFLFPPSEKLPLSASTIYMPPAPSLLHSSCSFWNLWIFLHHFLDFFSLLHASGRHSHSSPSLFSPHFLPPERLCQSGCKVTVWPVEVRVACMYVCSSARYTQYWGAKYKFHYKVRMFLAGSTTSNLLFWLRSWFRLRLVRAWAEDWRVNPNMATGGSSELLFIKISTSCTFHHLKNENFGCRNCWTGQRPDQTHNQHSHILCSDV